MNISGIRPTKEFYESYQAGSKNLSIGDHKKKQYIGNDIVKMGEYMRKKKLDIIIFNIINEN